MSADSQDIFLQPTRENPAFSSNQIAYLQTDQIPSALPEDEIAMYLNNLQNHNRITHCVFNVFINRLAMQDRLSLKNVRKRTGMSVGSLHIIFKTHLHLRINGP